MGGGVAVASNWGKSMQSQLSEQSLIVEVFHEPRSAVTAKFVNDLRDKYIDLNAMAELTQFPKDETPEIIKPTIPPPPEDGEEEDPPKLHTTPKEIQEETDKNESPEQRKQKREKRKQMVKKSKAGAIVRNHNVVKKSGKKSTDVSRLTKKKTSSVVTEEEIRLVEEEVSRNSNFWDLGGFSPQSFVTTKWSTLFPDLKKGFPLTEKQIYITRLWMFYLTRLEFLQYLSFLVDVGDDLAAYWASQPGGEKANLENIKIDVTIFANHCTDKLKKKILSKSEEDSDFSEADYFEIVLSFDEQLRDVRGFKSIKVYEKFFDNYDVFHENPLGFVDASKSPTSFKYMTRIISRSPHSSQRGTSFEWKPTDGKSLAALLIDARRCYPVINVDGNSVMAYYQPEFTTYYFGKIAFQLKPEFKIVSRGDFPTGDFLKTFRQDPSNEFAQEIFSPTPTVASPNLINCRFYGLNYEHLKYTNNKMFGVPFLNKLPFDSVVLPLGS